MAQLELIFMTEEIERTKGSDIYEFSGRTDSSIGFIFRTLRRLRVAHQIISLLLYCYLILLILLLKYNTANNFC